jgi:trehalose/maltose hydrolase-like predicted phosphorylase
MVESFVLAYDGFDPGAEGPREALTSTGNGHVCARGAAEWEDPDGVHYPGIDAHGVYNRETTTPHPHHPPASARGPASPLRKHPRLSSSPACLRSEPLPGS